MGDDCNVVPRRGEDSPSSASSTALGVRIKDLEECHVEDAALEERDFLQLSRQSGDSPEEEKYKISESRRVLESLSPQPEVPAVKEPLLFVPSTLAKSTTSVFPYFETKLRPDAPPFLPEALTRSSPGARAIGQDVRTSEEIAIEDSSFVNVELRSSVEDVTISSSPEATREQTGMEKTAREFAETIGEPEMRMISVTSTPRLKRSSSKIEAITVESRPANPEVDEAILVVAKAETNESDVGETREDTREEPRIVRRHWRILRTACVLSNNVQIIVFVASLVICMILVIYVVV